MSKMKLWNSGKKCAAVLAIAMMLGSLAGCSSSTADDASSSNDDSTSADTLTIAYQYGISYAPLIIMKEKNMIEENYSGDVSVEWSQLNSGSAISEGLVSGSVDVGAMGVAPFIISASAGAGFKYYSNISAQPFGLMCSDDSIQSLSDITNQQIALVNTGSVQHIVLAMACENELGDAHALDANILAMSHPDGMTSLVSGSIKLHLTNPPYLNKEQAESAYHEITAVRDAWPEGNSFIVGVATQKLYDENPDLYDALCKATSEAMDFINNNTEEAAEILQPYLEEETDTIVSWLTADGCVYSTQQQGIMDMADFMGRNGFIETAPSDFSEMSFEKVAE